MAGLLENVGDAKRSMECVIRVIASRQGLALPEVQLGVTVLALQKQRHMIGHKISHPGKRIESYLGRRRGRFSRDGGKMVPRKEQTGTDTDIRLQRCAGIILCVALSQEMSEQDIERSLYPSEESIEIKDRRCQSALQDVQKGHPARPQARQNRRHSPGLR